MKALLVLVVLALVVLSACSPSVDTTADDRSVDTTSRSSGADPGAADSVESVGSDVDALDATIDEDLGFGDLDSLDADLGELENLDY